MEKKDSCAMSGHTIGNNLIKFMEVWREKIHIQINLIPGLELVQSPIQVLTQPIVAKLQ